MPAFVGVRGVAYRARFSARQFYTMCQSFDFERAGKFDMTIFLAMVIMVKNSTAVFKAFSQDAPSCTFQSFDQFVYAASLI